MAKALPIVQVRRDARRAFREGHTLCPGCSEAMSFNTIGRATDNGRKTIFAMGTFCGEVSTLMYPNVIAWGRRAHEPDELEKSIGIIHNVFESAPTVAEAVRDTASVLSDVGAWRSAPPNVVSMSGDGGALSIGLAIALAHHPASNADRRVRQYQRDLRQYRLSIQPHGAALSRTAPRSGGGPAEPIDHIGLAIIAGAAFVAQASPAFAPFFAEVVEEALATEGGTAVVFIPSPCIAGWKFEEGHTVELGKLASQTGLFPCFRKRKGQLGEIKNVAEKGKRPPVESFLVGQRRFDHLVRLIDGKPAVTPGREADLAAVQAYADRNVEWLGKLAQL